MDLARKLARETTVIFRLSVLIAIAALAVVTWQQSRVDVRLEAQIESGSEQLQTFAGALRRAREEALIPADLEMLRQELGEELTNSFCATDPEIARQFARATFTADNRNDLGAVDVPTLVLQCRDDAIAGEQVGRYVHERIEGSEFVMLDATGHCPNLSAPDETTVAIAAFV